MTMNQKRALEKTDIYQLIKSNAQYLIPFSSVMTRIING